MEPTDSLIAKIALSSAMTLTTCNIGFCGSEAWAERQIHLSKIDQVNQGAFYTPQKLVEIAYDLIKNHIENFQDYVLIDTSCGYGSFLENDMFPYRIGGDIDPLAVEKAQKNVPAAVFYEANALVDVDRKKYNLTGSDKLIVVGNPPYNDTTSIIRSSIKEKSFPCDKDLRHRDMGMSFLLSFNKLSADYICVLHPLSYLIKKTNFKSIRPFTENYKLIDARIVSSNEFLDVSKITQFPIIVALYKRDGQGMVYDDILKFQFRLVDGKCFSLDRWCGIGAFVQKYPNQKKVKECEAVAKFYTLRDINALRRSRTFIKKTAGNTVFVVKKHLKYYCYLDVFKDNINHIPFYLGNCEPMIDNDEFLKIEDCFVYASSLKNPDLNLWEREKVAPDKFEEKIKNYFKKLLGEHYVE